MPGPLIVPDDPHDGAMEGDANGGADHRGQFRSKLGTYLTCLGCAVGTGNIWRFPRIVANNSKQEGGLVFLLIWLLFLFLWSMPMLVIEYALGRYTQKGVIGSFRELISVKAACFGAWIVTVSFMVSCYYSVILGWCLYYLGYCIVKTLPDTPQESQDIFNDFALDSLWPLLTTFLAIALAGVLVINSVRWIEKVSLVLVSVLLVVILVSFFAAVSLPHAGDGIKYFLTPHWESFYDIQTWIDALSQNAFDAGAGAGLMVSYASFMTERDKIVKYSVIIPAMNNFVSFMCGVSIFACVFATLISSYGLMSNTDIIDLFMDSGPGNTGLTFIWFPVLFSTFQPAVGRIVAILFFLCTAAAGLTSLMANIELFTLTLQDFGLSRPLALPFCLVALFMMSLMSALDTDILDNQDFVWGFGLVINGLIFVSIVIYYGKERFRERLVNNFGLGDWTLPKIWQWMVLLLLPLEGIGIMLGWALDLTLNNHEDQGKWNELGEKTFLTAIVEWLGVFSILFVVSMVFIYCCQGRTDQDVWEEHSSLSGSQASHISYDSNASSSHGYTVFTAPSSIHQQRNLPPNHQQTKL